MKHFTSKFLNLIVMLQLFVSTTFLYSMHRIRTTPATITSHNRAGLTKNFDSRSMLMQRNYSTYNKGPKNARYRFSDKVWRTSEFLPHVYITSRFYSDIAKRLNGIDNNNNQCRAVVKEKDEFADQKELVELISQKNDLIEILAFEIIRLIKTIDKDELTNENIAIIRGRIKELCLCNKIKELAINTDQATKLMIESISKRFNIDDFEAAAVLNTRGAKRYIESYLRKNGEITKFIAAVAATEAADRAIASGRNDKWYIKRSLSEQKFLFNIRQKYSPRAGNFVCSILQDSYNKLGATSSKNKQFDFSYDSYIPSYFIGKEEYEYIREFLEDNQEYLKALHEEAEETLTGSYENSYLRHMRALDRKLKALFHLINNAFEKINLDRTDIHSLNHPLIFSLIEFVSHNETSKHRLLQLILLKERTIELDNIACILLLAGGSARENIYGDPSCLKKGSLIWFTDTDLDRINKGHKSDYLARWLYAKRNNYILFSQVFAQITPQEKIKNACKGGWFD